MVIGETAVSALELADPLLQNFQPLFMKITLIFGGLFGLYIFVLILNVYYQRQKVKILRDVRYDLDQLNIHYNLKYSYHNKKGLSKLWEKIASLFRKKEVITIKTRK